MGQGRTIVAVQAGAGLISLALPFLLARHMAVADFAAYVTVLAAGSLLALVAGLGMDRVMYRFVPPLAVDATRGAVWGVIARVGAMRVAALALLLLAAVAAQRWTPAGTIPVAQGLGWWAAGLALAMGASELASATLQAALRPLPLAVATAAVAVARLAAIGLLVYATGHVPLPAALVLLLGGEGALVLACLASLRSALRGANEAGAPAAAAVPSSGELLRAGLTNHGAYLLGALWAGSTLRLLVAATSPVTMTAAYGFFQQLADRGRLYLPVAFMQRQVEPMWSDDFSRRGRVARFRAVAGAIGKMQFHVLAAVVVLLVAAGPWLIAVVVRPEYAAYDVLVLLIVAQQIVAGYGSLLWMGASAGRRNAFLARAMFVATMAGAPLLWVAARTAGAEGVVAVTMMPPLVIAASAWLRGDTALLRAVWRPVSPAQLAWALAAAAFGRLLAALLPPPLAAMVAPAVYCAGVALVGRWPAGTVLRRNERFVVARYLARRRA